MSGDMGYLDYLQKWNLPPGGDQLLHLCHTPLIQLGITGSSKGQSGQMASGGQCTVVRGAQSNQWRRAKKIVCKKSADIYLGEKCPGQIYETARLLGVTEGSTGRIAELTSETAADERT